MVVTRELKKENHIWLTALSDRPGEQDVTRLLQSVRVLNGDFDRELADSVLEVSIKANLPVLAKIKGGENMCQALMELMKPEIDKIREKEKQQGIELGEKRGEKRGKIFGLVEAFREMGRNDQEIEKILLQKYGLTKEEIPTYL